MPGKRKYKKKVMKKVARKRHAHHKRTGLTICRLPGSGFPDRMIVKLRNNQGVNVNWTSVPIGTLTFTMSNPIIAAVTSYGAQTLSTIYQFGYVKYSKVSFEFVISTLGGSTSTMTEAQIALIPLTNGAPLSNWSQYTEMPRMRKCMVNVNHGRTRINNSIALKDILGKDKLNNQDPQITFTAGSSAVPPQAAYWHLVYQNPDGSTGFQLLGSIEFETTIEYFGRKPNTSL
nr:MAG: capsid protein [Cressdnaviricota sp.]